MKSLLIILPALNEERVIGRVIDELKKQLILIDNLKKEIIVIDDGSLDNTSKIVKLKGITLLRHPINRGLGGALGTGLEYAKLYNADYCVTFDSDGQHDASDINKIIQPLLANEADVVIGQRNINKMPLDRRILTIFSSILTFLLFGIYCKDTQSGFRAFNKKAINSIKIRTQRMEVSSEFFSEIKKHKLKLTELAIRVIYTPYSRAKGQTNLNSLAILLKLVLRLFR